MFPSVRGVGSRSTNPQQDVSRIISAVIIKWNLENLATNQADSQGETDVP